MKAKILIAALAFPVLGLMMLTGFKAYKVSSGYEMTFDVRGYDPRDLLSGHYVQYRVDYGPALDCNDLENPPELETTPAKKTQTEFDQCVCYSDPPDPDSGYWQDCASIEKTSCPVFIKGACSYGRFTAGIEKFFVPEEKAAYYDSVLRSEGARLTVKIDASGSAAIVDLDLPVSFEEWMEKQAESNN